MAVALYALEDESGLFAGFVRLGQSRSRSAWEGRGRSGVAKFVGGIGDEALLAADVSPVRCSSWLMAVTKPCISLGDFLRPAARGSPGTALSEGGGKGLNGTHGAVGDPQSAG